MGPPAVLRRRLPRGIAARRLLSCDFDDDNDTDFFVVRRQGPDTRCDVVGPLCESSDTIGADRPMPPLEVGDLLAVVDTGAYGFVMASNYNRRTLPAEVLVDRGDWTVIRRRQTIDDMVALED